MLSLCLCYPCTGKKCDKYIFAGSLQIFGVESSFLEMKDLSKTELGTKDKSKSLFILYWKFIRRFLPRKTHESKDLRNQNQVYISSVFLEPNVEIIEIPTRYKPTDIKALSDETGWLPLLTFKTQKSKFLLVRFSPATLRRMYRGFKAEWR